MLSHINIKNFAIVDRLDLEFNQGLSVITGETGAGKSIVFDALGLILGDRGDSSMIRYGEDKSEISAEFTIQDNPQAKNWLLQMEMLAEEEDVLLIRRIIHREGRSRAFINGIPAAIQNLRQLGDYLVDIHGQHEHQSLLKADKHRSLLDEYAESEEKVKTLALLYRQWQDKIAERDALNQSEEERQLQMEILSHQVNELVALSLMEGEYSNLENDFKMASNAKELLSECQLSLESLDGEEASVSQLLNQTLHNLERAANWDDNLSSILELINTATIQVDEAVSGLRHYLNNLDLDPQRLQELEERMSLVHQLSRKHRVKPEELPAVQLQLQEQLSKLENSGETQAMLDTEISELEKRYLKLAKEISKLRKQGAKDLAQKIEQSIHELGMPGGKFHIQLEELPVEQAAATGLEKIHFQVSANPGQPVQALAKVASGGELSRISLAIQVITASKARTPTLVYDEVDVGIGGGIAEVVGRQLRHLSRVNQVISVTHLPQVAAQGHNHIKVSKFVSEGITNTDMTALDEKERIEEIARMLGGVKITQQTIAHAKEMIEQANKAQV